MITDLGFAGPVKGKEQYTDESGRSWLVTYLGTKIYMAPEIHQQQPYQGAEVDVFAAGVILFIFVTCKHPFEGEATKDTKYKYIMSEKHEKFWNYHLKTLPNNQALNSLEFRDLFVKMVANDPEKRPTVTEVMQHSWV